MSTTPPTLQVKFFKTDGGNEPVREWLKSLSAQDRKTIGEEIKTVQIGWPIGMPLVRKMESELWEARIHLEGRVARVMFTAKDGLMVLLHGFIKKSQGTPKNDLELALDRLKQLRRQV